MYIHSNSFYIHHHQQRNRLHWASNLWCDTRNDWHPMSPPPSAGHGNSATLLINQLPPLPMAHRRRLCILFCLPEPHQPAGKPAPVRSAMGHLAAAASIAVMHIVCPKWLDAAMDTVKAAALRGMPHRISRQGSMFLKKQHILGSMKLRVHMHALTMPATTTTRKPCQLPARLLVQWLAWPRRAGGAQFCRSTSYITSAGATPHLLDTAHTAIVSLCT